jgi:predicted secreted hydrolase
VLDSISARVPGATDRRRWLVQMGAAAAALPIMGGDIAQALPAQTLQFPRDHGAHPDFQTEWWYLTGHLQTESNLQLGFQITFFRSRVTVAATLQSPFAAQQLIFAHAGLSDVAGQKLLHAERIARAGFGVAHAETADTAVHIRDWHLRRHSTGNAPTQFGYTGQVESDDIALQLDLSATQPLLLQGQQGLSRKGPDRAQASYYYSVPHLRVQGQVRLRGRSHTLRPSSRAWLDHEWSHALLHPQAVGWDWIGINGDDGSALTAFRLRRADGTALWDGGSLRHADGRLQVFEAGQTRFEPLRRWQSPATQANYPTAWRVHTPAGVFEVQALFDAQELDSRRSTGTVYWEGLSRTLDAQGRPWGMGYLEMTGYASPMRL